MLAASVYIYIGSVWYSFVDAVSGFNQIRNTKRAREVLTIVARSGTYLPIGSRSAQSVGPTTSTTLLIGPMPFEGGRCRSRGGDPHGPRRAGIGSSTRTEALGARGPHGLELRTTWWKVIPQAKAKHHEAQADTNHPTRALDARLFCFALVAALGFGGF